jgi:hypothetical protein
MANEPYVKFLVVEDVSTEEKEKVVGYVRWWVLPREERFIVEERFLKWAVGSDMELCNLFFNQLAKKRTELMVDKHYYCESLISYIPLRFKLKGEFYVNDE